MIKLLTIIFLTWTLFSLRIYAEDVFKFSNTPVDGNEVAVLVLAPGMNDDGGYFLSEKEWTNFAKKHKLGMLALNFKSSEEDLYENRKGYYYPEQGSGKALLDEIKKVYGKDLPIVIYGFSGGAQFASRFMELFPDKILAWCVYSAQFWDEPKNEDGVKTRGIVACGDLDGLRWQPSFAFFYKGRTYDKPWIWVSISNTEHNRSAKFERFVRNFFDEELAIWKNEKKASKDLSVDVSNLQNVELLELSEQKELNCIFRTQALLDEWRKIQSQ